MNTFGNLGGALSPIVIGVCVDRWGSWHAPLFSVAVFYVAAARAGCWSIRLCASRPATSRSQACWSGTDEDQFSAAERKCALANSMMAGRIDRKMTIAITRWMFFSMFGMLRPSP